MPASTTGRARTRFAASGVVKVDHMHLCDRCLGQHMSSECNHKEITVSSWAKGRGKKGKAKGMGKSF